MADKTELLKKLDAFVQDNRQAILRDMQDILRFQTVSGGSSFEEQQQFSSETEALLNWLESRSQDAGFLFRTHNREVAVVQYSELEKFVALPVHSDVVPAGEGWTHPPFEGTIDENNVIWGRGTQDDKGPLIQMYWAMRFLSTLDPNDLTHGARLVVGTWEEGGPWSDIKLYLAKEPEAAISVISDAEFPIINAEKGLMTSAVIAEPPPVLQNGTPLKSRFVRADSGTRANVVPDRAEAEFAGVSPKEIETLEKLMKHYTVLTAGATSVMETPEPGKVLIRFFGKRAHASLPTQGHNAAVDLLGFLSQCALLTEPEREIARAFSHAGDDTTACWLGLSDAHPFVGATTVNLGILNWTDGTARAVFNIRPTLGQKPEELNAEIAKRFEPLNRRFGLNLKVEPIGKSSSAIFTSPETFGDYLLAMADAYNTVTGRKPEYKAIGGTTYAKAFPNAVCFGPLDPVEDGEELAHQVNERITVDALMRNIRIYALMLANICTK